MMNDYLLNLVNKAVSVGAGLGVSIILARGLGVELRGELVFITNIATLLAIVLGMGVNHAGIYTYRRDQDDEALPPIFGTTVLGVLVGFGAMVAAGLFSQSVTWLMIAVLTAATALYQQVESMMAAFNVRLRVFVNIGNSVGRLVIHILVALTITLTTLQAPIAIAVLCMVGSVIVYFLLGIRPRLPSWAVVGELLRFGWMAMISSLLVVLNYSVDVVLLKALGTPRDLGLYAIAAGLATYLWVIPDAIKEVLLSRVVKTKNPRTVLLPLRAALVAGTISVVGVLVTGPVLVPFLFGEPYAASYQILAILAVGVISMIYFKVLGVWILADGRRAFYLAALAVSALVNFVLNIFIIPPFGAVGAAWVTVATYSITGGAFIIYFARLTGLSVSEVMKISATDMKGMRDGFRRNQS